MTITVEGFGIMFPAAPTPGGERTFRHVSCDMSVRDYLASQAILSISIESLSERHLQARARAAYAFADKMIKARGKAEESPVSLRDYFAAQALAKMPVSYLIDSDRDDLAMDFMKAAYVLADAMMEARGQ